MCIGENTSKVNIERECDGVDYIQLVQNRSKWKCYQEDGNENPSLIKGRQYLHRLSNLIFLERRS